jgi:hypothetical protein
MSRRNSKNERNHHSSISGKIPNSKHLGREMDFSFLLRKTPVSRSPAVGIYGWRKPVLKPKIFIGQSKKHIRRNNRISLR